MTFPNGQEAFPIPMRGPHPRKSFLDWLGDAILIAAALAIIAYGFYVIYAGLRGCVRLAQRLVRNRSLEQRWVYVALPLAVVALAVASLLALSSVRATRATAAALQAQEVVAADPALPVEGSEGVFANQQPVQLRVFVDQALRSVCTIDPTTKVVVQSLHAITGRHPGTVLSVHLVSRQGLTRDAAVTVYDDDEPSSGWCA